MTNSHTFDAAGYHGGGVSAAPAHADADGISMWNIVHGIWARKVLFIAVFGLSVIAVAYYLATADASYTPQTRLLVESSENAFTRPQNNTNPRTTVDQNEVVSQVQVLLSADLANKVIKDLDLAQYGEFNSAKAEGNSLISKILGLFGKSEPPSRETTEQRILEKFFKKLNVYPVTQSRVIVIEFTASNPELAAKVANAVGETYVLATREVKYSAAKSAMTWLAGEISRLRQTVAASEAAVEEFRARKGLFRTERTTLNAQELAGVNSQIILAGAARSEAQARAKAIRDLLKQRGAVDGSSDVLRSTVIQRLREQQVALQRTYADQAATYLPNHPRMVRLQAEINDFSRQIRAEALKVVNGLENEARVQGAREASLRASLAKLKTKASTSNQDEITLRALEREAEANRSLLQSFLQRFSEASARQDVSVLPAGARIISKAQILGKPTFPKTKPLFMMGVGGAFLLALLVVFAVEVLSATAPAALAGQAAGRRDPVFDAPAAPVSPPTPVPTPMPQPVQAQPAPAPMPPPPSPVASASDIPPPATPASGPLPVLGPVIEELASVTTGGISLADAGAVCVNDPLCDYALAIRRVYEAVVTEVLATGNKRILWTSGEDLDDRAAILANLARTFAQNGAKVIAVDTDLDSDEMAEVFLAGKGLGLSDLLSGRSAFTDAVVRDPLSNLHILRQGGQADQVQGLFATKRMEYLLDALDQAYDFVIINAAPMTEESAQAIAAKAGSALICAQGTRSGKARRLKGHADAHDPWGAPDPGGDGSVRQRVQPPAFKISQRGLKPASRKWAPVSGERHARTKSRSGTRRMPQAIGGCPEPVSGCIEAGRLLHPPFCREQRTL